jgi:carboxymethylenebutenolidase
MGAMTQLTAADGHRLAAYRAEPVGDPLGGLVIIHEIFGLTEQMKRTADRYAEAGYRVIVPAMFDRVEPDLVLDYTEFKKGGQTVLSLDTPDVLADVDAAREAVAGAGDVAIMGFCWGGTVTYMAACGLAFSCGISYYGSGIVGLMDRMQPKIPVMYHFGGDDAFIPEAGIDRLQSADSTGRFYVY